MKKDIEETAPKKKFMNYKEKKKQLSRMQRKVPSTVSVMLQLSLLFLYM